MVCHIPSSHSPFISEFPDWHFTKIWPPGPSLHRWEACSSNLLSLLLSDIFVTGPFLYVESEAELVCTNSSSHTTVSLQGQLVHTLTRKEISLSAYLWENGDCCLQISWPRLFPPLSFHLQVQLPVKGNFSGNEIFLLRSAPTARPWNTSQGLQLGLVPGIAPVLPFPVLHLQLCSWTWKASSFLCVTFI